MMLFRLRKLMGSNKTVVRSGGQNKHNIAGIVYTSATMQENEESV